MKPVTRHLTRVFIAGIVALLPVGGLVLTVFYMEKTIAESWLAQQPYYRPGFGILAALVITYLIGLAVSTFLGRWLWRIVDRILDQLPALGQLYKTLKEILGYGEGETAVFRGVVLVRQEETEELGLITNEFVDGGTRRIAVFIPGAPNPTQGRLIFARPEDVKTLPIPVNVAMKSLVSVGKSPLEEERDPTSV